LTLFRSLMIAVIAAAVARAPAGAADIWGAGATFPYPIYAQWAQAYKDATGIGVSYQSIGSGGGIKQIYARAVTFGATDAPLPGPDLARHGLAQFPMVLGGIVPAINVPGIKAGELVLDGPTLARMFLGEIKTWDDPAIAKLNPSLKLPKQAIAIVHRSDSSGTTFNFVHYLADVSPIWKSSVGVQTSPRWPTGFGAKGNEGVAKYVANTSGAIGYVEYAYALQYKLSYAKLVNKDGRPVAPNSATFQAAAANADWTSQPGYGVLLLNQPGAQSWPITAPTWILVDKQPKNAAALREALKFFAWAYRNGGEMAEKLHYVPMPASVINDVERMWAAEIKDPSGKPILIVSN
jgi:phosphate transport system substrate-binding protein